MITRPILLANAAGTNIATALSLECPTRFTALKTRKSPTKISRCAPIVRLASNMNVRPLRFSTTIGTNRPTDSTSVSNIITVLMVELSNGTPFCSRKRTTFRMFKFWCRNSAKESTKLRSKMSKSNNLFTGVFVGCYKLCLYCDFSFIFSLFLEKYLTVS